MKYSKTFNGIYVIDIKGERLLLLPEKALLWEKRGILLLADMHLGKVNHFRRSGIAVSSEPNNQNIDRFINLLQRWKPERVLFMGDLFHSHYNAEWEVLGQVLKYFPAISFELIIGNHDIMSEYQYLKHQLILHEEPLYIGPFSLSHETIEEEAYYNIAGHLHPGVRLTGKGRQALKLPCFYFGSQHGLLPAFGEFTGLALVKPKKEDQIFVIINEQVLKV
ncbi:ligase-associated DNA damage response endonuclease PdeM [Fulvivirga sediminis]|uniref:Ligase-associated DNA damage response endonuclease PdeM n=1 Tax=Fulvivirga sediminis TaxID=2803949 RepID=A0A937FB94_9BACT|nr:ligase-associated DNA damage response endonuclease PdeM [Fulvivirga sediminis]MBL3658004.1 ligase-associated DNA damage response endonuclease PdeM [Fulvivirga sediminis]